LRVEKTLALGVYPEITLSDTRERREQARKLLASNTAPNESKKETRRILQASTINNFSSLAKELHKVKAPIWTDGHSKQWMVNIENTPSLLSVIARLRKLSQ
jgi:hypothetical protein